MFGNQRLGIVRGFFQGGQGGFITGISQGNANISQQPAPLRPQDGRTGEAGFEAGIIKF